MMASRIPRSLLLCLVSSFLLHSVVADSSSAPKTTAEDVFKQFSSLQKNLLALEAQDTLQSLFHGLQQHFGETGPGPKNLPTKQAVQVATNTMLGMMVSSVNDSLAEAAEAAAAPPTRRLQESTAPTSVEDMPEYSQFKVITVINLDDYVYDDGSSDDDDDDELNPWATTTQTGAVNGAGQQDEDLTAVFDQILGQYGGDLGQLFGDQAAVTSAFSRLSRAHAPAAEAHVATAELPQFAVFGPQRGSEEGETVVVVDPADKPPAIDSRRASDALILPLQDSARTQVPHNLQGDSTQLDARWWGIVAGVALCCLLAALVFIMGWSKAQSRRRAGGEGGDDYSPVDSAPLRPDARQLSGKSATTDDWVQAVRTKESKIDLVPGQAARKVSNLPA